MHRIFFGHPGGAAPAAIRRLGGVRWIREPDPDIRKEKKKELVRLIKPKIRPKSSASDSQEPPEPLLTTIQAATARMSRAQQTRTDRLLQETGISLEELLILIQ